MGKINAKWHQAHPMPKNPTLDQRIEWHLAHARACGCRAISGTLLDEMKRRGIKVPVFTEKTAARARKKSPARASRHR
jgi:hypothetical protein